MCGIVGYFGGAGNNLTRVLTAMSAMAYRAPDSTGLGVFGDDEESIRTRRSVGSVGKLIESLLDQELYPDAMHTVIAILESGSDPPSLCQRQYRLLSFEEFPLDGFQSSHQNEHPYPTFDDLVELSNPDPVRLVPGGPGRPDPLPIYIIKSRKDLKNLISRFTREYDMSSLVIQTIIRKALEATILEERQAARLEIAPPDILNAFDRLFEKTISQNRFLRPTRLDYGGAQRNPYAEKYLWRYLIQSPIHIPTDYDRDGVRCLFRLLDAALLCRLPGHPEISERLQAVLETEWPGIRNKPDVDWKTLYRAEKAANIYGRSAAAVLSFLQLEEYLKDVQQRSSRKADVPKTLTPGQTDPFSLRYLSTPILSHGRWALQSPVTLFNAHPFCDASRQRTIVLNGQFNGKVEADIRDYLDQAGGYSFRSGNSSEYLALLWGHYFENLHGEKRRYHDIRSQVEAGLEDYSIGSQSIDYHVHQRVKDKTDRELDALAFVEAVRRIILRGGQIAVAGMSIQSPRQLYVACHNRPVFVVRRLENDDFMVVSDINAALGLFPQSLIVDKTLELRELRKQHSEQLTQITATDDYRGIRQASVREHERQEKEILQAFQVAVYPLEGEEIFARIEVAFEGDELHRQVIVSDFEGNPLPDIEPFTTILRPTQVKTDFYSSFYESHLYEIPERLNYIFHHYVPDGESLPQYDLREKYLARRFGRQLNEMKRIILVGMGSAYFMGVQARGVIQSLLPEVEVQVRRPVEIHDVRKAFDPETDLVILMSWSATTGDMVQFATSLMTRNIAMIGLTEKIYADMARIAQKSGGVIPILSGEEVTVSGIKSTACMLYGLYLLAVWLTDKRHDDKDMTTVMLAVEQLPHFISEIITDEAVEAFCNSLARISKKSHICVILDDLYTCGIGHEAAMKLEENSWNVKGKVLDYGDLDLRPLKQDPARHLLIVNATRRGRFTEALTVMKRLHEADIPFAVVSFKNREEAEIEKYSRNRYVLLPKLDDRYQPFLDLIFYYKFAYHYGRSHGRVINEFPRNRVKSVTAALSLPPKPLSPAQELHRLNIRNLSMPDTFGSAPSIHAESLWEQASSGDEEKTYYRKMRLLAESVAHDSSLESLLDTGAVHIDDLARIFFKELTDSGEVIFIPLDRPAESAAHNAAFQWRRYLSCNVRVATGCERQGGFSGDSLIVFVASEDPKADIASFVLSPAQHHPGQSLWVGPRLARALTDRFASGLGSVIVKKESYPCIGESLYAGLCWLLIKTWKTLSPEKAGIVEHHMRKEIQIVSQILNSQSLKQTISGAMADNRPYDTALFIGPMPGIGISWVARFDRSGALSLERHRFGESAHGPLVTVDPRVERKFVKLRSRDRIVRDYGETLAAAWERRYMPGRSMDSFLKQPPPDLSFQAETPFFAEGSWYLPEMRFDYDASQDNLIIIDATAERYFSQALDELATFGCRYARIIAIAQDAFQREADKNALYSYPVSHMLKLPAVAGAKGPLPLSAFVLPFAMNILAMAMASASTTQAHP